MRLQYLQYLDLSMWRDSLTLVSFSSNYHGHCMLLKRSLRQLRRRGGFFFLSSMNISHLLQTSLSKFGYL